MPFLTDFIPQASFIPAGGNVGIGTPYPNERLTVFGNISATNTVFTNLLTVSTSADIKGNLNFNGTLFQNNQPFVASRWTAGTGSNIYRQDGNVGIGTTTPGYKLDVGGDLNFTGTLYQNGSQFVASRWTAGTGSDIYRSTGNVGIGTTIPDHPLTVNGRISTNSGYLNTAINVLSSNSADGVFRIVQQGGGGRVNLCWNVNGNNISYGTYQTGTDPASRIQFEGGNIGIHFQGAAAGTPGDPITWVTGMCVTPTGQVGIGNTAPGAGFALDVTGNVRSSAGLQINSLGVGTAASGTAGEIRATNNITAYFSDERLKEVIGPITSALEKVNSLNGFYYKENDKAKTLGYKGDKVHLGISAQKVQKILPEIVTRAPIDIAVDENGNEYSKTGEDYLTVSYDKLVPLLIEAINELTKKVSDLESRVPVL